MRFAACFCLRAKPRLWLAPRSCACVRISFQANAVGSADLQVASSGVSIGSDERPMNEAPGLLASEEACRRTLSTAQIPGWLRAVRQQFLSMPDEDFCLFPLAAVRRWVATMPDEACCYGASGLLQDHADCCCRRSPSTSKWYQTTPQACPCAGPRRTKSPTWYRHPSSAQYASGM